MDLANPKEMTLEELKAERSPLRKLIKRQERASRLTPELKAMKRRNIILKDEIEARMNATKHSIPEKIPVAPDFPDSGDVIDFSPRPRIVSTVLEDQQKMVVNA